jgi:hypothetical protein
MMVTNVGVLRKSMEFCCVVHVRMQDLVDTAPQSSPALLVRRTDLMQSLTSRLGDAGGMVFRAGMH